MEALCHRHRLLSRRIQSFSLSRIPAICALLCSISDLCCIPFKPHGISRLDRIRGGAFTQTVENDMGKSTSGPSFQEACVGITADYIPGVGVCLYAFYFPENTSEYSSWVGLCWRIVHPYGVSCPFRNMNSHCDSFGFPLLRYLR